MALAYGLESAVRDGMSSLSTDFPENPCVEDFLKVSRPWRHEPKRVVRDERSFDYFAGCHSPAKSAYPLSSRSAMEGLGFDYADAGIGMACQSASDFDWSYLIDYDVSTNYFYQKQRVVQSLQQEIRVSHFDSLYRLTT